MSPEELFIVGVIEFLNNPVSPWFYNPENSRVEMEAQIFVATLGARNYSYVEATDTQTLHDWIKYHIRAGQKST